MVNAGIRIEHGSVLIKNRITNYRYVGVEILLSESTYNQSGYYPPICYEYPLDIDLHKVIRYCKRAFHLKQHTSPGAYIN